MNFNLKIGVASVMLEKIIFLFFSLITGIIEIGVVIYLVSNNCSFTNILLTVLAYQIGCFFPNNIRLKKIYLIILGLSALVFSYFSMHTNFPECYLYILASILFISPCLQSVRSIQKSKVSKGLKRMFRILGFIASIFFTPTFLFAICFIIILILLKLENFKLSSFSFRKLDNRYLIMILHQMHYFSYAYTVLFFSLQFNDQYSKYFTAVVFALGWITYTLVPYILTKERYIFYLVSGHIYLTFVLLSMALVNSVYLKLTLWILTGLGGGTVFCIEKIFKKINIYNKYSIDTSENYGHVVGLISGILIFNFFKSYEAAIIFSSLCALLTAFLAIRINNKNKIMC